MPRELSSFLHRAGNPPSLPSIYYELVAAAEDLDVAISEIVKVILKDQGVASRLLRLANSAFYGYPAQIGTIDEAIQLIGVIQIRDLVLATSVIKAFAGLPERLVCVPSFWEHSIACGVASALLAEERRDPFPERVFVGGLLHDVGRLIMYLQAPEESFQILQRCEREGELSWRVERSVLGFDHAMLGAELLSYWRLPSSLVEMVGCHHAPARTQESCLVHYADFLTSALQFGNSGETFLSPLLLTDEQERFFSSEDRLDALVDELEKRCEEMLPIFVQADP